MGYQQGLSGLSASSNDLDVIGNNIANANTVGFKQSTAQFADLYANKIEPPLDGLRSVQDRLGSIQDCVASMPLLNGNSRAEAAIQRLLAMREQDFRTYWLANISKQRELWIASLEGTEESNGALSSSPRKSRAARTR